MGSGFQMDRDFSPSGWKKWLSRMTDGQRDAVVTAMYATLDDMRRAGKNDNMLRNAYMKYMCWLYYKFERIVNVLGGETLPKILYAGDVSHYELQLLTVLSRAGADIVLLECGGDQAYLTVEPPVGPCRTCIRPLAWGPSRRASVSSSFRRSWSGRCAASGSTARRPPSLPAPTPGCRRQS